ncbi:MAG: hypothetical protein CBB97_18975 [Candidatus Endolissoclinum sp. TMED37]|nr:MAG: hypothetical protein CBB97_18975 [Candidatus Endolissoclinum sp. TMED37]
MFDRSKIKASGQVHLQVISPNGELKEERKIKNLVVDDGLDYIASRMKDATATAMSHMEVGTGTTSPVAGDTTLETAIVGSRVALTSTTVTSNAIEYIGDFPAGTGTGAITEAGIFNASSAGTLLCRTTFAVVNKGAADTLKITWTVTVSDS